MLNYFPVGKGVGLNITSRLREVRAIARIWVERGATERNLLIAVKLSRKIEF